MSLIRVKEATPIGEFRLRLVLTNGAVVERDISALLNGPIFAPLRRSAEMFRDLRVQGGTVVWGNGADLCPDVLIWGGPPPKPGDMRPIPETLRVPEIGPPSS